MCDDEEELEEVIMIMRLQIKSNEQILAMKTDREERRVDVDVDQIEEGRGGEPIGPVLYFDLLLSC